jgi:UDP-4-amino-4,6-dideoxy-N-acetyl-beta-L-altrosamine transaminase
VRFEIFGAKDINEFNIESLALIPYGRQTISQTDIDVVVEVLRSDFLTQGPAVPAFEKGVAEYCQVKHAVAVNSATSALHIACLALGVGPGDLVWTSPITFVASANCARYCGADVDFVDIDSKTFNLCPDALAAKLELAKTKGKLPKVVVPVHFAGQPCDLEAVHRLSKEYGFRIIEDASHAIGARYQNTRTGDCAYSDITVFSFHPVKIITTAEGGMATTNSVELARKMQLLRSHGITREKSEMVKPDEGDWYYEQQMLGFNYRMTDLQAALGLSQLQHLDEWIDARHQIADRYDRELASLPITLPVRLPGSRSAFHLYPIQVKNRKTVFNALRASGIGVNVHYIPVHTQPDFYEQIAALKSASFSNAERYYSNCISIPMYASLNSSQQTVVIDELRKAVL